MKGKIAVLGAGSWGTALAVLLAKKGWLVWLWGRVEDGVEIIQHTRENQRFLPGVTIPSSVRVTADIAAALTGAELVVLSVPSQAVRGVIAQARPFISRGTIVVNTAKGIEIDSLLRMTEVLKQELPASMHQQIAVLSGPSHAEEVSRDLPTAIVSAAHQRQVAEYVQDVFMTPRFRVYTNPDVIGVELGGALKNIIALSAGIADGLGYGDNSKAALITRGIREISRLGVAMGAEALTFAGLSGIGDLVVTCTSMHSRNRRAGIQLGQGKSLSEVLASIGMVVEGVETTRAAYRLAEKYGVEMPITNQTYRVLFYHLDPREAVDNLMLRLKTHEVEEVVRERKDW